MDGLRRKPHLPRPNKAHLPLVSLEALGERLAFNTFHYQEIGSVLMTDVIQHADVWMFQAGDSFRFAFEALLANCVRRKLSRENLDSNITIKPRIARAVDLAHAALA